MVCESGRCENCSELQFCPCLVLDLCTEVTIIMLRKCGAAERALCEGHHGGLSLLWKAIEMVFLYISLGIDHFRHFNEEFNKCRNLD